MNPDFVHKAALMHCQCSAALGFFLCSQQVCGEKPVEGTVEKKKQPACQLFQKCVSTSYVFGLDINCEIAFVSCYFVLNLLAVNIRVCKERLIEGRLLTGESDQFSWVASRSKQDTRCFVWPQLGTTELPGGGEHCPWMGVYSEDCVDHQM